MYFYRDIYKTWPVTLFFSFSNMIIVWENINFMDLNDNCPIKNGKIQQIGAKIMSSKTHCFMVLHMGKYIILLFLITRPQMLWKVLMKFVISHKTKGQSCITSLSHRVHCCKLPHILIFYCKTVQQNEIKLVRDDPWERKIHIFF